jgi:hypothetical protein
MYLASEIKLEGKESIITNTLNGQQTRISQALTVIDCGPRHGQRCSLPTSARWASPDRIHVVGDALSPRTVAEATFEGHASRGVFRFRFSTEYSRK